MNDVIVGDRLTDNKAEPDDYRFHDVFHMAYAVHLAGHLCCGHCSS